MYVVMKRHDAAPAIRFNRKELAGHVSRSRDENDPFSISALWGPARMVPMFGVTFRREIYQSIATHFADRGAARRWRSSTQFVSACRFLLLGMVLFLTAGKAEALPAFAVQTGQHCTACHVGGFGPQLTPLGREFKLEGYTMRGGTDFTAPISAMAVASYLQTAKDVAFAPAPHYGTNDNTALDKLSLFLAGGDGDHFGGMVQATYFGVGDALAWDVLDLRAVDRVTIDGQDVLLGLTLNNSPSVEDAWNTLPAWGFPYTRTALAPGPGTGTVLAGLAQTVLGVDAYAWWNTSIYTEIGLYTTPSRGFLSAMGVVSGEANSIVGAAPYLRAAYQKNYDEQNFEIGVFGFLPNLQGTAVNTGRTNDYRDLGIDASYQFTGDGSNIYQVNAIYTNENQSLDASSLLHASSPDDTFNDFRVDASYYWQNTIGGTVQVFDTWGSTDPLLYAGNSAHKPDSTGFVFQVDGTPFGANPTSLGTRFNIRAGLQYTVYTKFNGASLNYNGFGRNASDNNALRLFIWLAM
jgi:hypothetical protein